ncbi:MAG TPA: HAD family hydrolase [Candidatus Bathyarchaeia archaeon]|nr:HAD family hydrolase [Candidatus Bathyarchaeia archaeon]
MYKRIILSLLTFLFSVGLVGQEPISKKEKNTKVHTTDNTIIEFDLGGVLIEERPRLTLKVISHVLRKDWKKAIPAFIALWKMNKRSHKDAYGNKFFYDNAGEEIHGATFAMIQNGLSDPILRDYTLDILFLIADAHVFKKGAETLLSILKKKGYKIGFATNKDRIAYNDTAEAMAKKGMFLDQYADIVHTVYPTETQLMKDMAAYRNAEREKKEKGYYLEYPFFDYLVSATLHAEETEKYIHMPRPKPELPYIEKQREHAGKKYVLFFDDHQENVDAVNAYGHNMTGTYVTSIHDVAVKLHACGILTDEEYNEVERAVRKK